MEVKIFDTHVRTRDGRYLHFDVLVTEELGARARVRSTLARRKRHRRGRYQPGALQLLPQRDCDSRGCRSHSAPWPLHPSPGRLLRPMDSYRPIACDLHDYLEIACLYRYRLLLELEDGVRFEAEARTTHTRAVRPGGGKEEYLEVAVEGATLLLRLDRLLAITALTEAALFGRIRLREEACSRASGMPSSHLGN